MEGGATARMRQAQGAAAKRLAIWVCLLGLPLGYEASDLLAGPHAFYGGDQGRWFAGLNVHLALMAVGLAVVLWALRRSGDALVTIGWPRRLRAWEVVVLGLTLAGAIALVFHHPQTVSSQVAIVTASAPVTVLERAWVVGLGVAEALVGELIWRGAMITWLQARLGTGGAALLSGMSYIFFHPQFGLSWGSLRVALPIALIYTSLFLWRRSIGPSGYLHFLLTVGQLLAPV